jgi:hypothetical protein
MRTPLEVTSLVLLHDQALPESDLPFPVHMTSRILHAIADRLLVNVQSDVIQIV